MRSKFGEGDQMDKLPMELQRITAAQKEFDTGADTFRHFQVMSNE